MQRPSILCNRRAAALAPASIVMAEVQDRRRNKQQEAPAREGARPRLPGAPELDVFDLVKQWNSSDVSFDNRNVVAIFGGVGWAPPPAPIVSISPPAPLALVHYLPRPPAARTNTPLAMRSTGLPAGRREPGRARSWGWISVHPGERCWRKFTALAPSTEWASVAFAACTVTQQRQSAEPISMMSLNLGVGGATPQIHSAASA